MGKKGKIEIEEIERGYILAFEGKKQYHEDLDDLVMSLPRRLNAYFKKMNSLVEITKKPKKVKKKDE